MTQREGKFEIVGLSLIILSQFSAQFGSGVATTLFPLIGPVPTVAFRLVISAVLLLLILRPKLRGLSREAWIAAILLGISLASMNSLIYISFTRIPLGTAVTIEMLGPLLLSVIIAKRLSSWILAAVAFAGVWLLSGAGTSVALDPLGILLALGAGACWASYIVFSRRTSMLFRGIDGLAVAMTVGAVIVVPLTVFVVPDVSVLFTPQVLLIGAAVAVLSSALPYGLEQLAIRRLRTEAFAMLLSLSPVIATLVGFLLLGQHMSGLDLVGIALVVIATALAMRQRKPQ